VVAVGAKLDKSSLNDVEQTEDRIVSQWREVSADEKHQMREQFDKISAGRSRDMVGAHQN